MKTTLTAVLVTLLLAAATTADVSGTWDMKIRGAGAHGDMTATLALNQEHDEVTGTMTVHGTEHVLSGEFENGTLRLTVQGDSPEPITLTARLKDDGTLSGYASGPMGDMQWTAVRAKDK